MQGISRLWIVLLVLLVVTACTAAPSPEAVTVRETVVVEVEKEVTSVVEVEKEVTTVVEVEKEVTTIVEVEKEVTRVVEVEKEVSDASAEEGCGHEIILATNGDSSSVDPIYGTDAFQRSDWISEPLVYLDWETLVPIPWLAESWEVSEDGTIYTFHLREGPAWPDGTPLTAQDFEFTLLTILSPDVNSTWQGLFSDLVGADQVIAGEATELEGLSVLDEKSFQITLNQPNAAFLSVAARNLKPIPKHLLEGETLDREHPFMQNPVGVGPYQLVEWARGDHLTLEAKDDYWGEPVCATRITDRYITDMNALALALEAGQVDMINPITPRDVVRMRDDQNLEVYQPPANQMDALWFNTEHEVLSNPAVRRAIAMTINREEFINSVLSGVNRPVFGHLVESSWAYDPAAGAPEYDLEGARALLAEAGYPDGFTVKLVTNAGNTTREQFLTYLQSQLEKIGVTAEPEFKEWSTFITGVADGDFEIAFLESTAGVPDPDTLRADYHTDGATNYGNYSNSEVDSLLDEARVTTDLETRKELYGEVQQILAEELPRVATWEYLSVYATGARIENVRPSAIGKTWDAGYWRKME